MHGIGNYGRRTGIANLFEKYEFLEHLGERTIDECFGAPASVFTPHQRKLLRFSQSLGVISCVLDENGEAYPTALDGDNNVGDANPNGYCCDGSECTDKYENPDDYCDLSNPCSAGSTACPTGLFTSNTLQGGIFTAVNMSSIGFLKRASNGQCKGNSVTSRDWTFHRIHYQAQNRTTIKIFDNISGMYIRVGSHPNRDSWADENFIKCFLFNQEQYRLSHGSESLQVERIAFDYGHWLTPFILYTLLVPIYLFNFSL